MPDYPNQVSLPRPGNNDSMAEGEVYAGPVVINALAEEIEAIASDLNGGSGTEAGGSPSTSVAARIEAVETAVQGLSDGVFSSAVSITTATSATPALSVDANASSASVPAVTISVDATSGSPTTSALKVESAHPTTPTVKIDGQETSAATLSVVHTKPSGADSSAAAVTVDLKTSGTAANGVVVSTPDGPTTGDLLKVTSNSRDELVVKGTGRVGIGMTAGGAPTATSEVKQTATGTPAAIVTGITSASADLLRIATSTANRIVVNSSGDTTFSGAVTASSTVTLSGTTQIGSSSTTAGGVRVLGIADATTVPSTTPSGGGVLYSESGALKWRDSNGIPTQLAPNTGITNGARANTYVSNHIGGTATTNTFASDTVHFFPIFIPVNPAGPTHQVGAFAFTVETAYNGGTPANNKAYGALYATDAYGFPGTKVADEPTVTGVDLSTTGLKTVTLTTTSVAPGKYWVAIRLESTATITPGGLRGGTGVQPGVPIISPPSGNSVGGLKLSGGGSFPTVDGSTVYTIQPTGPTIWLKLGAA